MIVYALAGAHVRHGGCARSRPDGRRVNSSTGTLYELDAIAACVVGGVSTAGGVGRVGGIVAGVLVFGVIAYGLTFIGINPFTQQIIKGVIIIGAVAFDIARNWRPAVSATEALRWGSSARAGSPVGSRERRSIRADTSSPRSPAAIAERAA